MMEEMEEAPKELLEFWEAQAAFSNLLRHTRHSQETDACPSMPRFAAAAINPRLWTEAEKGHMQTCPYCQKLLPESKQGLWHPTPFALLKWKLKRSGEEEAKDIQRHIEQDKCLHCENLMQTLWFQMPLKIVSANQQRLESFEGTMARIPLLLGTMPPLVAQSGLRFATEPPKEYNWNIESEDGTLSATILKNEAWTRNTKPGDLVALINAPEEHAERTLHIKIENATTSETIVEGTTVLQQRGDRAVGRVNFGAFTKIAERLGDKLELKANYTDEV